MPSATITFTYLHQHDESQIGLCLSSAISLIEAAKARGRKTVRWHQYKELKKNIKNPFDDFEI